MATEYGFVYVLANESMPGIYKIGFTMGHPKNRMAQLSSSTACPTPFTLLAAFGCENPSQVESEIHRELDDCRVNSSREFFKLGLNQLLWVLRGKTAEYDDDHILFLEELESEAMVEEYDKDQEEKHMQWKMKVNHFLSQCADPIYWPEKFGGLK